MIVHQASSLKILRLRLLSSPFSPEDKFSKKTKAESDSESESDPESVIEMATLDPMDSLEPQPEIISQTQNHVLTLLETELQKLSEIVRPAVQVMYWLLFAMNLNLL